VLVGLGAVEQRYRAVLEVPGKAKTGWAGWRIGLRPAFCPHLMPALVEARIVAMRLALARHGPVAARRRRRREDYRRWGSWTTGLVADGRDGPGVPGRGAEVKVAAGIDDHSWFAGAPWRCPGPRRSCRLPV
jgi:hypothetical protein